MKVLHRFEALVNDFSRNNQLENNRYFRNHSLHKLHTHPAKFRDNIAFSEDERSHQHVMDLEHRYPGVL